jgi:hypothetical protein
MWQIGLIFIVVFITGSLAIGLSYFYAAVLFFVVASGLAIFVLRKIEHQATIVGAVVGISLFAAFPVKRILGNPGTLVDMGVTLLFAAYFLTISSRWKFLNKKTRG